MRVVFLPVRHHSPTCALQVRRRLEELNPAEVLIEGPADFNPHFERLQEADVVPPVALFTYVARQSREDSSQMERFQGWYPFCDYSPEWVALKTAARLGVKASFIDLPLSARVELDLDPETTVRLREGAIDLFAASDEAVASYVSRLGQKIGARDGDDTWDRLFEVGSNLKAGAFFENLRSFGASIREMTGEATTAARGELERERFMAARITEALERSEKTDIIAVICGAFHVPRIEEVLAREVSPSRAQEADPKEISTTLNRGIHLVPYDFKRMARLHYAAGVPAPAWYQAFWQELNAPNPAQPFWVRILGQSLRAAQQAKIGLNTADMEAASEMALRLAAFRGQGSPSRYDLLDAVRTTWIKGPLDSANSRVLGIVDEILRGDRAGDAGPSTSDPPLVQDVDALLDETSLTSQKGRRDVRLRPLRSERDRERMRLLLRLKYLGVHYGEQSRGPRYLEGKYLERIEQVWCVGWSPETRSDLFLCASYGPTLEGAVTERLREKAAGANGAAAAVGHLTDACALGLHEVIDSLLKSLSHAIDDDHRLLDLLRAVQGLTTLYRYRDVLGAVGLPALAEAIGRCWERALWLMDGLPTLREDDEEEALEGLRAMAHAALTLGEEENGELLFTVEPEAFYEALERLRPALLDLPGLHGGVGGLLWRARKCLTSELAGHTKAHFQEASLHPEAPGRFTGGLLAVARSALLHEPRIVEAIGEGIKSLDEEDFRRCLPRMRRAMASLTPSETTSLARRVVQLWGSDDGDSLELTSQLDGSDQKLLGCEARVRHELKAWGLPSPEVSTTLTPHEIESIEQGHGYDRELLRRWRLVLGRYGGGAKGMPAMTGEDGLLDEVVGFLVDREYSAAGRDQWAGAGEVQDGEPGGLGDSDNADKLDEPGELGDESSRQGGQGSITLTVPEWINHLRVLFPRETCERLESEALHRYDLKELVTQAEVLDRCLPTPSLLEAILRLKHHMDPEVLAMAKRVVGQVAEDLRLPLLSDVEASLSGMVRRGSPTRQGRAADFDAPTTIRRNLKNWNTEKEVLVIEQPWFARRVRRQSDWRVIVAVDQSGSMLSSAIYAAITAGIFFSIPDIHAHLVVFSTIVVDLTDQLDDPVETLLSINLGGGTDIARAVGYCMELVTHPPKSLFILISDLYEGGNPALLLSRVAHLLESGVKVLVLGALDPEAEAAFDPELARKLVSMGAEVGAMTPKFLVRWVGEALK